MRKFNSSNNFNFHIGNLDGLDLKREKEKASGAKKKKIYNEQEEMESQRRLQEQLQNIEPPKCGPKCFDVSRPSPSQPYDSYDMSHMI